MTSGPITGDQVVIDASAVVALLTDGGADGRWVTRAVAGVALSAPELAPFEAANVLRRNELAGRLDSTLAVLAHRDLAALGIGLWPYSTLADRAWELRHTTTVFDGSYVALAELLDAPLVTLDERLARAPGPRCSIRTPRTG